VKRFWLWVDSLFRHYEWTDDLADFLWSGRCHEAIVLVSDQISDMTPWYDYARWLRNQGDWDVSVEWADFIPPDKFVLVQFRGPALFWPRPKTRNDWFTLRYAEELA